MLIDPVRNPSRRLPELVVSSVVVAVCREEKTRLRARRSKSVFCYSVSKDLGSCFFWAFLSWYSGAAVAFLVEERLETMSSKSRVTNQNLPLLPLDYWLYHRPNQ